MRLSILILILAGCLQGRSQLNCKVTNSSDRSTVKTCYHRNGGISTEETWDADKMWGRLRAFSPDGLEILNYDLRRVAGHASVYLEYYPSGQVRSAEYSSAPDGGIQYYRYFHVFSEDGKQTEYRNESWDNSPLRYTEVPHEEPVVTLPKPAQEVAICAAPAQSVYKVLNTTGKRVSVRLKAKQHPMIQKSDLLISLNPGEELTVDSILMADLFFAPSDIYEASLIAPGKKASLNSLLLAGPEEMGTRKEWTYVIVRRKRTDGR